MPIGNQVLYTNALVDSQSDFQADVLYTHKKMGFEQDIIMHQQPPAPASFGLNPDTTMLQVWTEFYNTADPEVLSNTVSVSVQKNSGVERRLVGSEILNFGSMQMDQGNAFSTDGSTNIAGNGLNGLLLVPVAKHWVRQGTRRFLVEEIPFDSMVAQLNALPPSSRLNNGGQGTEPQQSFFRSPTKNSQRQAKSQSLLIAKANIPKRPGLVMDYNLINNSFTDFTFQSDTTYYLSGSVYLYNTTTLEGGTVIKCDGNAEGTTVMNGNIVCLTGPYRPAIFTCTNDNSVGVPLSASNSPTISVSTYLYCPSGGSITNVRFSYGWNALSAGAGDVEVSDCQFVNCNHPITVNSGVTNLGLHNVLISMSDGINNTTNFCGCAPGAITVYSASLKVSAEHLTADLGSQYFLEYYTTPNLSQTSIALTNSIVLSPHLNPYYSYGTSIALFPTTNEVYYSSIAPVPSIFQPFGAGNYYLPTNSVLRGIGTTNINPNVLADLQHRTTSAPAFLTNTISANTILNPQVQRDGNGSLDIGYHYDPLDFLSACTVTNSSLLLTNGVALGYYSIGVLLTDGSQLISQGTPLQKNYLAHVNLVQEQSTNVWLTNALASAHPIDFNVTSNSRAPNITMRFTTISAQNSITNIMRAGDSGQVLNSLNLRDCEIYAAGGSLTISTFTNASTAFLQNNLVHRPYRIFIESPGTITTFNNLFVGTGNYPTNFDLVVFNHEGTGTNNNVHVNNAFDGLLSDLDGTYSHSAYLNGATRFFSSAQTGDIITNLSWFSGPLGGYYQATSGPLTDAGNPTADLLGLYQYTTQTNQVKEANSRVDIGYHYVALDTSGKPMDSNGNGIPDYLEDSAGNGSVSISLVSPSNSSTYMEPAAIPLQAMVLDWSGAVTNVEFFAGSTRITATNAPPYTYSWPIVPAGAYSLTAVGHDANGLNFSSSPVSVTVTNFCNP
ncbi:MAG TPA: Ig-like domain-containing protein [Verrucomicrobiae bacterium]|nr:Ig-like domain-containing protein [Verrucomicrobiae bacterium]